MQNFIKYHEKQKQISLTGARALVVLIALIEGPKTFPELREKLIEIGVVDKQYSVDTIRIDINTLKNIGCEIKKATKLNNNRYELVSHPFVLKLTIDEVEAIKTVYTKRICKSVTPDRLLEYHKLFLHLAEMVKDDEIRERILGISLLKHENIELLEQLLADYKKHNRLTIEYSSPTSNETKIYDINIERLALRNGKLYVYCYNNNQKKRMFLNVSRIKKILSNVFDRTFCVGFDTTIKFKLKNHNYYSLNENEVILEEDSDSIIVEGNYFNDFIGIQRMLEFGPDCVVYEPEEIKTEVIQKLYEMRQRYDN